jgi:hypothetical protein
LGQELEFARRSCEESKAKLGEARTIYENKIAAIEEDNGLQRE